MTKPMGPLLKTSMLALSIALLSSCVSSQENPATPLSAPTLEESATPFRSSTSRAATALPTLQHTSTIPPTMTLMPTLPAVEAEAKVLELLRDNGGCRLPCFWGFTPGQTSMQTFDSFWLTLLAVGGSTITLLRDDLWLQITVVGGSRDDQSDILDAMGTTMIVYRKLENENVKVFDNPFYAQYFQYYTLPYLLSNYGPPTNAYVFLDVGIADMGLGIDLYLLFLDYTESGWVAMLTMPLLWQDESRNVAMGCPTQAFTHLQLWSPGDTEMAKEYGFADGAGNSKSVEEATSQTLEEFYQQFKNPMNALCLETPLDAFYTR
jgi:hypothetical protein